MPIKINKSSSMFYFLFSIKQKYEEKLKIFSWMSRFTRDEAIQILPKFALANLMRSKSQSRIFFKEKDEAFIHKKNSKKLKNSSRIRQFICREAIQLKAKFALANLIKWKMVFTLARVCALDHQQLKHLQTRQVHPS
jgi:hypothetical protein